MKTANLLLTTLLMFLAFTSLQAQKLVITSVNEHQNLVHKDRIGTYAWGDTLFIKATYQKETCTRIGIQILTFKKDPWARTDGVGFDMPTPLTGTVDTFIVVPQDYTVIIPDGDEANTQMLQVRGDFTDGNEFANIFLDIIDKHPTPVTFIDFDAEYGVASGSTLVNNITDAVSRLSEGDTLLFKSSEYDFEGNSMNLEKAICLSGILPTNIKKNEVGAYDVKTTFKNMKNFNVKASNVNLTNLKFIPDETIGYVFTRFSHSTQHQFYTGILVNNVIFQDGDLQCYGEDGAGITFRNVSFLNFIKGGYSCNRKYPHDDLPKSTFKLCHFVPNFDHVYYNTQGVSMDAGNDNHPIPWDCNGMHIDSCLFDGNGCGWSKGANGKVTNCHFIGYRGDVDMIHFEEYTNNIHVENNLFEYSKPSRTFFIDRELQPLSDITIINNTFKGKYKFIFWGNSQFNLRFEGNDLTQAEANDVNYKTFDFTAYHKSNNEEAPFSLPMENLIIRNNTGINKTSIGEMTIFTLNGDNSNIIEDYPTGKITNTVLDFAPKPLLDTTLFYRIENKASGEAMVAVDGSTKVKLSAEEFTDSSDIWEVKFVYPYTYTFLNRKTKQYMEIYNIYTLGDYSKDPAELPTYYVEQKSEWAGKLWKPHWLLSKVDLTGEGEFQIYPGTNEKKSRVIKSGSNVVLDLAQDKENKTFFPANEASTWKFVPAYPTNNKEIKTGGNLKVYPNPAKNKLYIDFNNEVTPQSVKLFDANGREVYSKSGLVRNLTIDVKSFDSGIYYVQVQSNQNTSTKKVIINQ